VLVEFVLRDAVELHAGLDDVVAHLLVLLDELGDVCELLAVLDFPFEQLCWVSRRWQETCSRTCTNHLLLLGDMAVQAFEPVELGQLVLGVCCKSAKGLEETVACVVLIPSAVRLSQSLEQFLLFLGMPLRVPFA